MNLYLVGENVNKLAEVDRGSQGETRESSGRNFLETLRASSKTLTS